MNTPFLICNVIRCTSQAKGDHVLNRVHIPHRRWTGRGNLSWQVCCFQSLEALKFLGRPLAFQLNGLVPPGAACEEQLVLLKRDYFPQLSKEHGLKEQYASSCMVGPPSAPHAPCSAN